MRTAGEVLDDITRLAAAADWTEEEIDEALREEGVDPDELVRDVRARLAEAGIVLGAQEFSHPGGEA